MKCRYARMAIYQSEQKDLISKGTSREEYIRENLGENIEFKHGKVTLYYSPRVIREDIIAGVIEKKASKTFKTGPWENEKQQQETFNTANFSIRLVDGQEVALEQENKVYTGQAIKVLKSLGEHINKQNHEWHIDFRQIGSTESLDDYLQKYSGYIKKITIVLEKPNADFGAFQSLHDDLKASLSRIRADRLKKEYTSDISKLDPDEEIKKEMNFANQGNGELKISNNNDAGNSNSFQSKQTEYVAQIWDRRKIDEVEEDSDKEEIARNMLDGFERSVHDGDDN